MSSVCVCMAEGDMSKCTYTHFHMYIQVYFYLLPNLEDEKAETIRLC